MRHAILAFGLFASSPAAAMTAEELMPACALVPDLPSGKVMSLPTAVAPCLWYLGAMHDLMGVNDVPEASVLNTCPRNETFTDTARLFVRYVKTHPVVRDQRAALAGLLALREAYPCPTSKR